jgi:hypothetical protein
MSEEIWKILTSVPVSGAIISGVFGLIGGIVGTIFAPWVNWGIEKRRNKRDNRRQFLEQSTDFIESNFDQSNFHETNIYASLKPYLSRQLINDIESIKTKGTRFLALGNYGDPIKLQLLEEIARLKMKWGFL